MVEKFSPEEFRAALATARLSAAAVDDMMSGFPSSAVMAFAIMRMNQQDRAAWKEFVRSLNSTKKELDEIERSHASNIQ